MSLSKTIEIDVRKDGSFDVHHGNRVADNLSYGEMLGLVTRITCVGEPREMQWLKVPEAEDLVGAVRWFHHEGDKALRAYKGAKWRYFYLDTKDSGPTSFPCGGPGRASGHREVNADEAFKLIKAAEWPEGMAEARKLAGLPDEDEPEEARWYEDRFSDIRGYLGDGNVLLGTGSKEVESTDAAEHECVQDKDTKLTTGEVLCKLARMGWEEGWDAAREFVGLNETEAYLAGQEASGIKAGDLVKVDRSAGDFSFGWGDSWFGKPDPEPFFVEKVNSDYGVLGGWINFPFFVLSKVEQEAEAADPATDDEPNWREGVLKAVEPVADWFCLDEEENTDRQLIEVVGEIAKMLDEDRDELMEVRKLSLRVVGWLDEMNLSYECLDDLRSFLNRKLPAAIKVGDFVREKGATKENAKFKVTRTDDSFVYGGEKWLYAHNEVDIVDPPQAKVGDWVQSVADDCHENWKDRPLEVCRVIKGYVCCKVSDHQELAIEQGKYEIVDEPPKVKLGDWVRFKELNPPEPFPVSSVTSAGVGGGDTETGTNFAKHGDYEIVRKVVKPWTFEEACKALSENGDTLICDGSILHVANVRKDRLCFTEGHHPTFSQLANEGSNATKGANRWHLANGDPCGTVDWEAVE